MITLNANNGVLQNAVTYPSAKVGQVSFGLNGSDQKILIGNPASMQLQNFTIDAWIKRADTGAQSHTTPPGHFTSPEFSRAGITDMALTSGPMARSD